MRKSTLTTEIKQLEAAERNSIKMSKRKIKLTKEDIALKNLYIFGKISEAEYNSRLSTPICTDTRYSDTQETSKITTSKRTWKRKNLKDLSDNERKLLGLATTRNPELTYLLMQDGTKICNCCQKRKPANFFSNASRTTDGKVPSCKDCEYLRSVSYRAAKKL